MGVRNSISGAISATYDAATDRLTVDGPLPGRRFSIVVNEPGANGVEFGIVTSTLVITKITLKGTPTAQASGTYIYTLTTSVPDGICTSDSVNGIIEIAPKSTIKLLSGSVSETVCDNAAMTPVQFQIGNALSADVLDSSLPSGVFDSFAGGILTISGTPDIDPAQSTTFTYTVTTTNNDQGCLPEASFTAQITVNPSPVINVAPGSNPNPTICAFETMSPLQFTVSNPAFGLELIGGTLSTLDGVTSTLNIRPQILEHTFGGAG